jgi:rSAM/selenodomain-associated transferase 1
MSRVTTECAVAILAKAPVPGLAKTRLIPHLGAEGAAALQRWLLRRTLGTALAAELGPVTLWCAPETDHPDFAACQGLGPVRRCRQPDVDLGGRMHAAVDEASAAGTLVIGTLVIGTDCPALTPEVLREAAAALREHDAVVIPAEDGGYVLIGLRQPVHAVFQRVEWSTERVMAQTRRQLQAAGLTWRELAPLWDVDRFEDVERLLGLFPDVAAVLPDSGGA